MKLGKKPARKGAIQMAFGDYFDRSKMPPVPRVFGHERIGTPWKVFGNDQYSDCVFAGAAHEHMVWTHEGSSHTALFTDSGVLADYSAVTGFDPRTPDSDQGTDMEAAASYRRKTGVADASGVRHKVDAYVSLRVGNADDLALAAYLMGAAGVGIQFPASAETQFDKQQPWDVVKGSQVDGGHYIPCIGRNSAGNFLVVTWGRIQAMTPAFYDRYCDEAVCYLSIEMLRDRVSPEGFDEVTLRQHLSQLSSHGATS